MKEIIFGNRKAIKSDYGKIFIYTGTSSKRIAKRKAAAHEAASKEKGLKKPRKKKENKDGKLES